MHTFMTDDQVRAVQEQFGTPVFVYDQRTLENQAREALAFPNAYGLTVRYAMKALPTAAVLRLFTDRGLHIDASSGYEAHRAMRAGVPPSNIQLTAQELAPDFAGLVNQDVLFCACSLHQLRAYGEAFPGTEVTVRINPGLGSGHNNRTNVGGPSASFGIWREHIDDILELAQRHGLRLTRMHTHIGSGGDPGVWAHCAQLSLAIVEQLPEVTSLSLGGGLKVARVPGETGADLRAIGERVKQDFTAFAEKTGRRLHAEIEPGTFLVANAGALVAAAMDVVDTGPKGRRFIKIDSGMTEILRPSLYGAQHPIRVVPREPGDRGEAEYLVVGHCCESGDILTPEPGDPESLGPRALTETCIGDAVVIGGAGAYCSSMAATNYNAFPQAPEVLLETGGAFRLIRKRQSLDQIIANEIL